MRTHVDKAVKAFKAVLADASLTKTPNTFIRFTGRRIRIDTE